MSDHADLDRDMRLAGKLGELPPPALPAGLTARIVANATRLPQQGEEPAAPVQKPEVIALPLARHRRRWLPHALATAIAASLVVALLWQQGSTDPVPRATPAKIVQQVPASRPAPLPQVKTADAVQTAPSAGAKLAKAPLPALKPKERANAAGDQNLSPDIQPEAPAPIAPTQDKTPQLAQEQNAEEPPAQAFVGPPASDDRGAPIVQRDPATGLGITGNGNAPSAYPAPPPPRTSRGRGSMPHF